MTSWFDIKQISNEIVENVEDIRSNFDLQQVQESINLLKNLIEDEKQMLPDQNTSRIFIGGFSQGAMISLATLLTWDQQSQLGGVVALSGM